MGCSASRSTSNFITSQQQQQTSNSSSSLTNSPYHSFSDPCTSTPVSRTISLPTPLVHHPPLRRGDSSHFVSLTSTTYGSLILVDDMNFTPPNPSTTTSSNFLNRKPQVITVQDLVNAADDPSSPDSVINTWELMEGLDEDYENFDFQLVDSPKTKSIIDSNEIAESYELVENPVAKPLGKHLSEESLLDKMDSNVVSSYRKALSKQNVVEVDQQPNDIVSVSIKRESNRGHPVVSRDDSRDLMGADNRIVLYHTSLRGIRKTYEDCCAVRVIFRGFRVCVDEKDISMDRSYRTELQEALKGKAVSLPQVFIKGKYIGGAEEIKQLNEGGDLAKLLEGFPLMDLGFVCESCGDARFVPCPCCNGSRKVYEEEEGNLRMCMDCNENGLARCSSCCP